MNRNHDSKGRFASGPGGSKGNKIGIGAKKRTEMRLTNAALTAVQQKTQIKSYTPGKRISAKETATAHALGAKMDTQSKSIPKAGARFSTATSLGVSKATKILIARGTKVGTKEYTEKIKANPMVLKAEIKKLSGQLKRYSK